MRIRQLKIQLPFPVEVVGTIPCEDQVKTERDLHNYYDHVRCNGEWFHLPEFAPGEGSIDLVNPNEVIASISMDSLCSTFVLREEGRLLFIH